MKGNGKKNFKKPSIDVTKRYVLLHKELLAKEEYPGARKVAKEAKQKHGIILRTPRKKQINA
jgi:hypothetical protein